MNLSRGYISALDGLRAIAVLAVILFHMELVPFLQGGFTGVDMFFVISGYVISKSLADNFTPQPVHYIAGFYRRRLTRLLPALLVMLLVTTLATALFIPASWLSSSIDSTGLSAFFGTSNFRLALEHENYFSPRVDFNPFLHTWSLALEEQFYLIFPLIYYFQLKAATPEKKDGKKTIPGIILAVLAGASLLYSGIESLTHNRSAYYLLPGRFWELAAGAILFQLHSRGRLVPGNKGWSNLSILAGLGVVGAGFFLAGQQAFPFPGALLPVLGTALLISGTPASAGAGATSILQKILSSPLLTYIGRISYSLYLWHWPVAVLFRWTFGFTSTFSRLLYLPVTFMLAMVSYHFIENPVRNSAFLKSRKNWEIVTPALAMLAAGYLTACFITASKPALSLSVTKDAYIWQAGRYDADAPAQPVTTVPGITGRKLFAVGDSHTAAYRTMLHIVSRELGIDVYEYEQGGSAVAGLLRPMDEQSAAHYRAALLRIKELAGPGDVIFLASLRMPEFTDLSEPVNIDKVTAEFFSEQAVQNRQEALAEAHGIVASFTSTGAYVVLAAPLPVLFTPPYRCADWFNRLNPIGANGLTVRRDFLERIRRPVMESISILTTSHENLYVWDPFPVLCTGAVFSAYDEQGKPVFRDGDHLSGHGNRILVPSFREFLVSLWSR